MLLRSANAQCPRESNAPKPAMPGQCLKIATPLCAELCMPRCKRAKHNAHAAESQKTATERTKKCSRSRYHVRRDAVERIPRPPIGVVGCGVVRTWWCYICSLAATPGCLGRTRVSAFRKLSFYVRYKHEIALLQLDALYAKEVE